MAPKSQAAAGKVDQLKSAKGDDPIAAARGDLARAEARLAEITGREAEALESAEAFASWRRERDEANAEVGRCRKRVEQLEVAAAEDAERERLAALLKRRDDQQKTEEVLGRRILEVGGPAIETLLGLARDTASAAIASAAINAQLPEGEDKIIGGDMLARHRAAAPREVLSEKKIQLWTFVSTGSIVGNQGDVVELGDGSGQILTRHNNIACVRRDFWQIEYREAEPRQLFQPFFAALRLPAADGPGFAYSPREGVTAAAALRMLEQRASGEERPILMEIRPYRAAAAAS